MADDLRATNGGRTLSDAAKEQFAYELALGYFSPEELRQRFGLKPSAFDVYLASPAISDLVLIKRRELDESDFALRIHARRAARVALEECIKIVKDPDASAKMRMDAGRQIREIAEGVDKPLKDGAAAGEGMLILKTNLTLEGAKGVYTITANEIDEQLAENDAAREAQAAAAGESVDDQIMRLLGV